MRDGKGEMYGSPKIRAATGIASSLPLFRRGNNFLQSPSFAVQGGDFQDQNLLQFS